MTQDLIVGVETQNLKIIGRETSVHIYCKSCKSRLLRIGDSLFCSKCYKTWFMNTIFNPDNLTKEFCKLSKKYKELSKKHKELQAKCKGQEEAIRFLQNMS